MLLIVCIHMSPRKSGNLDGYAGAAARGAEDIMDLGEKPPGFSSSLVR
jgi:hypothetical protein